MEISNVQATEAELQAYYDGLGAYNVAPLWTVLGDIQAREPASKVTPYVWRWSDVRPLVMRAAELVGTEQAERRVLRLMNPGLGGRTATTQTLFGGIQTVLPGEIAPPTATPPTPCASSSRATAATPQSAASASPCSPVTSSSPPRGSGTTTATTPITP